MSFLSKLVIESVILCIYISNKCFIIVKIIFAMPKVTLKPSRSILCKAVHKDLFCLICSFIHTSDSTCLHSCMQGQAGRYSSTTCNLHILACFNPAQVVIIPKTRQIPVPFISPVPRCSLPGWCLNTCRCSQGVGRGYFLWDK